MRILALDTATEGCSAALLTDAGHIGQFAEVGRGHADRILAMVDLVLAEGECSLSMLDGIAAGIGPGSFTGVRISVAVAQGLAFGAGLPVIAVTTLEALALNVLYPGTFGALACLDARMGEVYWQCFVADEKELLIPRSAPRVDPPADVHLPLGGGAWRGVGRGLAAYPQIAALPGLELNPVDGRSLPDAREIARIGAVRLRAGRGIDPADLQPLYLRDKVALTEAERAVPK